MDVRPAGDLVQVRADARDLPGALALDLARRRRPGLRPRHRLAQQLGQRHARRGGLSLPRGQLGFAHASVRDDGARRSWATARHGLVDGGSKGEHSGPLAKPNVAHWVYWLTDKNPVHVGVPRRGSCIRHASGAGSPGRPHNQPLSLSGPGCHPEGRSAAEDGVAVDAPGVRRLVRWCRVEAVSNRTGFHRKLTPLPPGPPLTHRVWANCEVRAVRAGGPRLL